VAIEAKIWIYWAFCIIATIAIVANRNYAVRLLSPNLELSHKEKGYKIAIALGWVATIITAICYILLTHKYETGNYKIPDLLFFSVSNGTLEQFMFVFWFLLGCFVGRFFTPNNSKLIFISGYIGYAIFSGLIHALFWIKVLPPHEPATLVMPPMLSVMSLIWMWLIWRYQAIIAIIAMHVAIDFLTVGHLNFSWFDPFQLV
jgi:chlorophyllide a hydrolase